MRGVHPGIFALVNGLSRNGVLTPGEEAWRRAGNDWYDAAYAEPSRIDPLVYDRELNPGAVSWFRSSAGHLVSGVEGYLKLLDAHGVPWQRVESDDPGRVVYQDDVRGRVRQAAPTAARRPAKAMTVPIVKHHRNRLSIRDVISVLRDGYMSLTRWMPSAPSSFVAG